MMSGRAELTGKVLTLRDFSIYGVKNGQMLERGAMNARNVFQAIRAFTRFASVQGGVQVVRIEGVRTSGPQGNIVRLQAQINSSAPGGVSISRGWRN